MDLRFHTDPESGEPHIYDHRVTEEEVRQVLVGRGDDFSGADETRGSGSVRPWQGGI